VEKEAREIMMFDEYPHVKITFLGPEGQETREATCEWCGSKVSAERLFNESPANVSRELQAMENSAQLTEDYNELWKEIEREKIDRGIALYKLAILRRKRDNDPLLKGMRVSEMNDRCVGSCQTCQKPVGINIHAISKVEDKMPPDLTPYLKKLAMPPNQMIARRLEELGGGTIEGQLAKLDGEQYRKLAEFAETTRTELLKLGVEPYLTEQFDTFLSEFKVWVEETRQKRTERFWNAMQAEAERMAAHGLPPSLYEKLTAKIADVNDRVHGKTGLLLTSEEVKKHGEE
jgi:hypothetical protein